MVTHDAQDHIEKLLGQRIDALEKFFKQRFDDSDEAIRKAETAAEKRFDGVNEFRSALSDQQSQLMPRNEAQAEFRAIREKISTLSDQVIEAKGRGTGFEKGWLFIVAGIGVLATIISIFAMVRNK